MQIENEYLLRALYKSKSFIIVKRFKVDSSGEKSKLEYISPNADIFGLNPDTLKQGYRLLEDYVHPEDRNDFVEAIHMSYAQKNDFSCETRLVGDDGKIRWVNVEICLSEVNDDGFLVEIIMTDISDRKKLTAVPDTSYVKPEKENKPQDISSFEGEKLNMIFENGNIAKMLYAVADIDGFYSAIIDKEGNIIVPPNGQSNYLGEFYDILERPKFKEIYEVIKNTIEDGGLPVIMETDELRSGSLIVASPLRIGDKYIATWILFAYDRSHAEKLRGSYSQQGIIANMMSQYIYSIYNERRESSALRDIERELEREIRQKEIITDTLGLMSVSVEQAIENLFEKAGRFLDLDKIILYTLSDDNAQENKKFYMRNFWTAGDDNGQKELFGELFLREKLIMTEKRAVKEGILFVDNSNITNEIRVGVMKGIMRAVMAFPIVVNGVFYGWLAFIESKHERVWTDSEKTFAKELSRLVQRMMRQDIGEGITKKVNKYLLDTYNYLKVGIFIRDTYTGEVLFSNKSLNHMIGYDLKGKDSRVIMTDLHDKFDDMAGMRNLEVTKNKVMTWRKYLSVLDAIVDITEIQIEWTSGDPASMVIIRWAQD